MKKRHTLCCWTSSNCLCAGVIHAYGSGDSISASESSFDLLGELTSSFSPSSLGLFFVLAGSSSEESFLRDFSFLCFLSFLSLCFLSFLPFRLCFFSTLDSLTEETPLSLSFPTPLIELREIDPRLARIFYSWSFSANVAVLTFWRFLRPHTGSQTHFRLG